MHPQSIAILGGGLTGLSSAFHLARKFPKTRISLLEAQSRLGGWIKSERVHVPEIGISAVLEGGPRTLRPGGKSVLELINLLRLHGKVLHVPKSAPPAKARYLYVPPSYGLEHTGLQRLPSSLMTLVCSPFLSCLFLGGLRDITTHSNGPPDGQDESIDSLLSRRFGSQIAHLFGSALVHGIYAADSRQISAGATFNSLQVAEKRGRGSIIRGLLKSSASSDPEVYSLGSVEDSMRHTSVYSFRDGMQTLTDAIEHALMTAPNVEILKAARVLSINQLPDKSFQTEHTAGEPVNTTHVVSAVQLPVLRGLLVKSSSANLHLPLQANPMSSVQVVNFVFPGPPAHIHPEGFGYLIPRPPSGYTQHNTTMPGILGTVFDSCSLHEQDSPQTEDYYRQAGHTKLTVMVGGPYHRPSLPPALCSDSHHSDTPPTYITQILEQLGQHLSCTMPKPVHWRIWNNEDCIPTLLPGHAERMRELKRILREKWDGRLAVVSAGVDGVSVPDCVEAGRHVGREWM